MRKLFLDILGAPVFPEDEEKTRRARVLNSLQLNMGIAVLVLGSLGAAFLFTEKVISSFILLIGFITFVIGMMLNRRGRRHIAACHLVDHDRFYDVRLRRDAQFGNYFFRIWHRHCGNLIGWARCFVLRGAQPVDRLGFHLGWECRRCIPADVRFLALGICLKSRRSFSLRIW